MREQKLPEWAARIGAEIRDSTEQLPTSEPYLVQVTELLRLIRKGENHNAGRTEKGRTGVAYPRRWRS